MENKSEGEILLNDARLTDLKEPKKALTIKNIILFGIISTIIIILIIILFLLLMNSSSSKEANESIISCIYDINSNEIETKILGDEFISPSKIDIYINETKIIFTKIYKFTKSGIYNIKFKFDGKVNMDNMFKDVVSLKSIQMNSLNDEIISSMISSFENCINLESFSIDGFSLNELRSTKKLFYNTNLKFLNLTNFNSTNLEDISYMFASTQLEKINLNFNTENVKNILFYFVIAFL